jgi:hypothetical protein
VATNPNVELETKRVLGVVSLALNVFGGDVPLEGPPAFAAERDLENDLGRGYFGSPSAVTDRAPIATGAGAADLDGDGDGDTGDRFSNDFVDRLVTGGSWTWADGGRR